MIPVNNNILYMGKSQFCWEDTANTSINLTDLFYNKTELYHDYIAIEYNTDITGKIQPPYVNKLYSNTLIDDRMY